MFFVAKATLCIGLVAVVASQAGGGSLATSLDGDARDAAVRVGRACLSSRECLAVGTGVLAAASGGTDAALRPSGALPHAGRRPAPGRRGLEDSRHRAMPQDAAFQGPSAARG